MKRMKHVRICELWTTVADILFQKNSEIAANEKKNQNQIGKSYIYSFGGEKKKKNNWKVKIAYLLARTPQHCQKPNDTVCITLAPGTKQTSSKKVHSSNLGRRLSPHNHRNYLHSGCLWLRFVVVFFL